MCKSSFEDVDAVRAGFLLQVEEIARDVDAHGSVISAARYLRSLRRRSLRFFVDSGDRFVLSGQAAESLDVRRVPDIVSWRRVPEFVGVDLLFERKGNG